MARLPAQHRSLALLKPLLRRNDPAQGMTPRQDDAAVVQFGASRRGDRRLGQDGPVSQGAAAGGAPVGLEIRGQDSVTLRADLLHGCSVANEFGAWKVL